MFVKSIKASQKIIGSEMGIFNKLDLNFKTSPKQKVYENIFLHQKGRMIKDVHTVTNMDTST